MVNPRRGNLGLCTLASFAAQAVQPNYRAMALPQVGIRLHRIDNSSSLDGQSGSHGVDIPVRTPRQFTSPLALASESCECAKK